MEKLSSYNVFAHPLVERDPPPTETDTCPDHLELEDTLNRPSGDCGISHHHTQIKTGVQSGSNIMESRILQRQCSGPVFYPLS